MFLLAQHCQFENALAIKTVTQLKYSALTQVLFFFFPGLFKKHVGLNKQYTLASLSRRELGALLQIQGLLFHCKHTYCKVA